MPTLAAAKGAKKARKSFDIAESDAMKRVMIQIAKVSERETLRSDTVQRAARAAITATLDAWISWKLDNEPQAVEDFFREITCLATGPNRRKIFKHADCPEDVIEEVSALVEAEMAAQRREREAPKASSKAVEAAEA